MLIAVIDCGTNTFHLLIAETKANGNFKILLRKNIPVKLGEGGITQRIISETPFKRGMDTLKSFSEMISHHNVEKTFAYATAAVRNAVNGIDFINKAKEETGIEVELIDGQKEAELIYYGVRQAVRMTEEKVLIMDIGGGSVEFIIANNKKIFWKHSFEIGAALLLAKFKPSDPISEIEIEEIKNYLDNELKILFSQIRNHQSGIRNLIGSSGSFDTFAEMVVYCFHTPGILKKITEYDFRMDEYKAIHMQLLKSTTRERKKMEGLVAMRVDMIVIASILLTFVLEKTGIRRMKLSAYALKEGVLYKLLSY